MFSPPILPASILEEICFPSFPSPYSASILAAIHQLEQTQWWQTEALSHYQQQQLALVLNHANKTVPFYRDKFKTLAIELGENFDFSQWSNIPIISRQEVQEHQDQFLSEDIPQKHLPLKEINTSGSTGTPLTWSSTVLIRFFQQVLIFRDHLWHKRDFSKKHGGIRYCQKNSSAYPEGSVFPSWNPVYPTGASYLLNIKTDPLKQLEWIQRNKLNYLITYPSNALALAELCLEKNLSLPELEELLFFGEVADEKVKKTCQEAFDVLLTDTYSANEVGYIALQCPEQEHYHIQSENLYVEILDDQGNPCQPGQVGKVVLTTLHNFAKPLIRYAIGDYAVVGELCSCGRGLPVLKKILGRTRNLLTFPSGERFWPTLPHASLQKIAPVKQRQFVQKTKEQIEVRLVVARNLTEQEEDSLTKHIQKKLGYPFQIIFVYQDKLSRSKGGKFEEFISEV